MEHKVTDAEFYRIFAIITIIIVALSIFIAILSNVFAGYSTSADDNYKAELQELTHQRTEPTGRINLASNPVIKQEIQIAKVEKMSLSGEEAYNLSLIHI